MFLLAEGIQTCKRSEANFQQCLSKAIQSSLTTLKDGSYNYNFNSKNILKHNY